MLFIAACYYYYAIFILSSVLHCIGNIILMYVCYTIISTSAWLCDYILGCIVPLFDCSLSSLKWIAVTSAVHVRLLFQVVECTEHHDRMVNETLQRVGVLAGYSN